jgi:hypothetical protein
MQRDLLEAVDKNQGRQFVILGGSTTANLNFPISKEGTNLLMVAASKGSTQMLHLMIANKTIEINKQDRYGVNAFWIAAFYGRIEFMQILN